MKNHWYQASLSWRFAALRRLGLPFSFICVLGSVTGAAGSGVCEFDLWMTFKKTKIYHHNTFDAYYFVTDHAAIDADGAPNAYHPNDIGKNCVRDEHVGLDCPANAGYPNTNWWSSVLVTDPDDPSQAYRQEQGPYEGYFLSMTWLSDNASLANKYDPSSYVDASKFPYFVFPGTKYGNLSGTGFKGDVGYVMNLDNNLSTGFVVADQGGGKNAKLGEASVALFEALGGKNPNPRTGSGVAKGQMLYVLFPGSRNSVTPAWPRTRESIQEQAEELLASLGGWGAITSCFE